MDRSILHRAALTGSKKTVKTLGFDPNFAPNKVMIDPFTRITGSGNGDNNEWISANPRKQLMEKYEYL